MIFCKGLKSLLATLNISLEESSTKGGKTLAIRKLDKTIFIYNLVNGYC